LQVSCKHRQTTCKWSSRWRQNKHTMSSNNARITASRRRSKSASRLQSRSKPSSHGTPRSNPPTPRNPPRRHNSMNLSSQHHSFDQQRLQNSRQQSRNTSPSPRSSPAYNTSSSRSSGRRAHFDTSSDTASAASSSTSPAKTVASDSHPALSYRLTSPETKSTLSNTSSGIVRKKDRINSVKKTIEGACYSAKLGYRYFLNRVSTVSHSHQ
jgi:hypothetical protein